MQKERNIIILLGFVLFMLPVPVFAQNKAFEERPWNVNVGLGVGLYKIIPMPDLELSASRRIVDFYRLGLQFNCLYLHGHHHDVSRRFQYQTLLINTFDFYSGVNATWSVKVGLGYMYLYSKKTWFGDLGDVPEEKRDEYRDGRDIHTFSTLAAIMLDYKITESFSLGFSVPLSINFNQYHEFMGGLNLLFNMGFHW